MGTLFNQKERPTLNTGSDHLIDYIEILKNVSKVTEVPLSDVIKAAEVKELIRKNDLYVINGDIHDEQMQGLGELIKSAFAISEGCPSALEAIAIQLGYGPDGSPALDAIADGNQQIADALLEIAKEINNKED